MFKRRRASKKEEDLKPANSTDRNIVDNSINALNISNLNVSAANVYISNHFVGRDDFDGETDTRQRKPSRNRLISLKFRIMSKADIREEHISEEDLDNSISDIKKMFFSREMFVDNLGVRFIFQGKELRNSEVVGELKLGDDPTIYVFFFKVEKKCVGEQVGTRTTQVTEPNINNITDVDALDFDYFSENQNLSAEEVTWKRFCFHSEYIFRTDISFINDAHLFSREHQFMKDLGDDRKKPDKFRKHIFKQRDPFELKEMRLTLTVLTLASLLLGVFISPLLIADRLPKKYKLGLSFGVLLNLSVLLLFRLSTGGSMLDAFNTI